MDIKLHKESVYLTELYHRLITLRTEYGFAIALAVLLHVLVLLALLQLKPAAAPKRLPQDAVLSYLYQPAVPAPVAGSDANSEPSVEHDFEPVPAPKPESEPESEIAQPEVSETAAHSDTTLPESALNAAVPAAPTVASEETVVADAQRQPATSATSAVTAQPGPGLASRALQQAGSGTADMAQASYQHYLQQQQPQKLSVAPQHQELSLDPAKQVLTTLDNGLQIVRVKGGCRLADPTKDGFDALMAARRVSCGDEAKTSDLLKQALEKHSKR